MNTSQLLNLPVHPTKRHPLTGQPLQALGHRVNGAPIWPIMGGSEGATEGGDAGADGADGGDGADAGKTTDTGDQGKTTDDGGKDKDAGAAGKVEDLPDWAQKTIRDLRKESGDRRTQATQAETERTKLLDGIAQALGLKRGDDAPTPEQLASQLTTAQETGKAAQIELAVFKAAATAGADPVGLTDSRSFMTKVGNLDPAAKDFAAKVKAEIETAISENPKLKAGRAPGASSVDHPGGPGNGGAPRTPKPLTDAVTSHYS